MSIAENISELRKQVPSHVKIVAVSKTKPVEDIMEAYDAGQRMFGENKVQEMIAKQPELPEDIDWHMIGHLQSNKVKYIAPYVSLIESVDSLKLLKEINKQATKCQRTINCLLQFHIASEETKFGLDLEEARQILGSGEFAELGNVRILGVMGMGTFTDDEIILRKEFSALREIFEHIKSAYFPEDGSFREISMGMTGDYMIAIEEGSTMVRIGTGIFGARNYH
jgi:pyridoxal phosphate enzyme (YggS family)